MRKGLKSVPANPRHEQMRLALVDLCRAYGDLSPEEILALASVLVGQLVAMQDQRKYTPGQVMSLVAENIERGNQEAIASLFSGKGGTA